MSYVMFARNVTPLRASADTASEQVSQAIMGDMASLLETGCGACRVETADGATCWAEEQHLLDAGQSAICPAFSDLPPEAVQRVTAPIADVYAAPDALWPLTKLVMGTRVAPRSEVSCGRELGTLPGNCSPTPARDWPEASCGRELGTLPGYCTPAPARDWPEASGGRELGLLPTGREVRPDTASMANSLRGPAETVCGGRQSVLLPTGREVWLDAASISNPLRTPVETVCATALACVGTPYLWGGSTPFGFDCSGLTQRAFLMAGVVLPRDAWQQAACSLVRETSIEGPHCPADLVFFLGERDPRGRGITHVGIALNEREFIHCCGAHGLIITPFDHPIYQKQLRRCGRVFN